MKNKFLLPLIILVSTSCSQNTFVLKDKVFCFDTYIETNLYEGNNEDLSNIKDMFTLFDKLSDNYLSRDVTNIFSINSTNEELEINPSLYSLIKTSIDVNDEGATYFNPLCGSLSKKWKAALKEGKVLSQEEIDEELVKMNNSSIFFKDNNIIQRIGEAEIDLGGIAKGYTLDIVNDYLKEKEYKHFLINGGSSSILLGEKKSSDGYFNVGLRDLSNAYIKAKNCFISTSSKSVQGVKIGDITYSHIINPTNGSAINENDAVIVISQKGYLGDALSTSMMMNTIEEIKQIEIDSGVKTIVIKNNHIIYKNDEIDVYYH
ncbi:MAG: FAD:protein FMN transferase [Bacilli bacterium]|nr:FAD:protein FMN transferase [Bacilli bacterium]